MDATTLTILIMLIFGAIFMAVITAMAGKQTKVVTAVITVILVMGIIYIVVPEVYDFEEAEVVAPVDGASDWNLLSSTLETDATIVTDLDEWEFKQPCSFNDTGDNFNDETEYVQIEFYFDNAGVNDGGRVICTVTDVGTFEDDSGATTTDYWMISRTSGEFDIVWTFDSTSVTGDEGPTIPDQADETSATVTVNLTASADAFAVMDQADSRDTVITFTNSKSGDVIDIVTITWDKTTLEEP